MSFGHVVHVDQLDAALGRLAVGVGGGNRVGRNGNDDLWVAAQHGLEIGDLLLGIEAGVGDGHHLDAHRVELGLEPCDLRIRPGVAGVVHQNRRLGSHGLDRGEFSVAELHVRR